MRTIQSNIFVTLFFLSFFLLTVTLKAENRSEKQEREQAIMYTTQNRITQAVQLLNTKFMSRFGFLYDYVGEHPTPKDCLEGRPSAIGWWSPIENAAMFSGLYLPAVCERAARSGNSEDRDIARRLAHGLLLCASVSNVPGFISRGVATDGKTFYSVGSEDQTASWFHGLFTYWKSDIPTQDEKKIIKAKLLAVASALFKYNWQCPCDGNIKSEFRGEFLSHRFLVVPCYLFMLRACYELSHDNIWLERYDKATTEKIRPDNLTRPEICAKGFRQDESWLKNIPMVFMWIYVKDQYALRDLVRMETDPDLRRQYKAGLDRCADEARQGMLRFRLFSNKDNKIFGNDWRNGYSFWKKQNTLSDVMNVANQKGNYAILGKRKGYERSYMTNPLACAAVIALAGRSEDQADVLQAIGHYDYSKMNLSEFFYATIAFYGMYTNSK